MPETQYPKLHIASFSPQRAAPAPITHAYAELAVTTNFSFLRGASHPDELVARAAELGYRAIGVTDFNSLAGIVRMHVAAKELGIKLVVGARLTLCSEYDLLVWPINRSAYGTLCRLLTLGKRRSAKGECDLSLDDFLPVSRDFHAAMMPRPSLSEIFTRHIRDLKSAMDNRLSIAAACVYESDNDTHLADSISLSRTYGVPLLATNDVHYHTPERRALQDTLTCIKHGCTINEAGFRLFQNGERYLKTPAQMHALFIDHPKAIRRGLEIAEQCTFNLDELQYDYPRELTPTGSTPIQYLADLAWKGAAERYPDGVPEKVRALITRELTLIEELKIEAYFLTVHDLVSFARQRGILCQGRGSAANSAVCYCIGVTAVDPVRIDVLFERFVSAARNEPPDIDLDLEHERREEVIQYVYQKYGRDRAGMTAEVITYRGRSAVRDVGKALGLGLDTVDHMAKRLDWWDKGTLADEKLREIGLDPADRTVRMVIDLSGQLLGFPRHLSQHVGGMVMTQGQLCEMVPIENASMPDRTVIEWDKTDIDDLKILKVDVLALGMLTCIAKSLQLINQQRHDAAMLTMYGIPAEDPAVYEMICDADTVGVFQIESRAQMTMLPRLKPKKFYDLVIEVAIVRPGPIQGKMVHPYLRRRNNEEAVTYPSEEMREVLEKTLGVPLFQEQAMRVAMVGAGFSAEEADRFRRAMASWRKGGAIDEFRRKIIEGMTAKGYTPEYAEHCFNMLRGFGEYGFPESHSASFALLVYVSSWIKRHHPAIFCCALLNSQPMGFYAPAQIVRDAEAHGVKVLPPDVNESDWDCTLLPPSPGTPGEGRGEGLRLPPSLSTPIKDKTQWGKPGPIVRLGFRMIRGFHRAHADKIMATRNKITQFRSIEHFWRTTSLPVHSLKRLAEADAFGSLGLSRREALWRVLNFSNVSMPLFEQLETDATEDETVALPIMPMRQEVMTDYRTAGLSLKAHPVALIRSELQSRRILPASALANILQGKWVKVAGLVLIRQRPSTASGIVFETIEDETGVVNLIVKPKVFERYQRAARHATLVQADGYVERQGQVIHVMVVRMTDLSDLVADCDTRSRDFH